MRLDFLDSNTDLSAAFPAAYDPAMLAVSLIVAFLASYVALSVVEQLRVTEAPIYRAAWLALGGLTLGGGVFAMHFIGMLAYVLPIAIRYDLPTTLISILPSVIGCTIALQIIGKREIRWIHRVFGGVFVGTGIGTMHYTGMMAMRLDAEMLFDPALFALSIGTVVLLAIIALSARPICIWLLHDAENTLFKIALPLLMSLAISGMHYTAMAATYFFPKEGGGAALDVGLDGQLLGVLIGSVVAFIFIATLTVTYNSLGNGRRRSTRPLLASAFLIMIALMIAMEMVAFRVSDNLSELTTKMHRHPFTVSNAVQHLNADVIEMRGLIKDVAHAQTDAEVDLAVSQMNEIEKEVYRHFEIVMERFLGDKSNIVIARQAFSDWKAIRIRVIELRKSGRSLEAVAMTKNEGARHTALMFKQTHGLIEYATNKAALFLANSQKEYDQSRTLMLAMILAAVLTAGLISFIVLRKVKRSEDELAITLNHLDALNCAMDEHAIISMADPEGNITYVNDKFCEISQFSRKDLLGQNHRIIKSEEHPNQFYKTMWGKITKGEVWHGELKNKAKDSTHYWVSASIVPILDKHGQPEQYISIRTDITERKTHEKALKAARTEAETATRAKSDFLANMSHEIRTPMNAVIGLTDLCLKTDLSRKQHDYLTKVSGAAMSLLGVINDILDFSKIEAGKMELESIPFDLDGVLDNLATVLSVAARDKGLELLFSRSPDIPLNLIGDPLRLGQVLTNLGSNAVKFTESGEIVVGVSMLKQTSRTITLEFFVRDSGIGMSKKQVNGLFQSFTQADSSTTRKYGGTGLGLTISQQLVGLMDGQIKVHSRPGLGTTFTFTAKVKLGPDQDTRKFTPALDLRGMRVLVVDDSSTSQAIFKTYLESFSFDVTLANTGKGALDLIKKVEAPFDLVLLDWRMPGLTGLQTAEKIKSRSASDQPPAIILISAHGREELIEASGGEFIDGFVAKPTNLSQLFNAIMRVFGQETLTSSHAQPHGEFDLESLRPVQGARILLVEDNEVNQQVASELLEQARFIVDIAKNGQEAIERLETHPYECVLMDVQMPVMDGYEATRHIRKDARFKSLPILAMTANVMLTDRQEALAAGMDGHIAKPINPEDLYENLLKWIEHGERALPERQAASNANDRDDGGIFNLPSINARDGLARIGGNREVYRNLLAKFVDNQADVVSEIRIALSREDLDLAARLAHTLKGVAGNIGAEPLQKAAQNLDLALKKGQEERYEALLNAVSGDLNRVVMEIQSITQPREGDAPPQVQATPEEIGEHLRKLQEMLDLYDSEAEDILDATIHKIGDPALKAKLQSLKKTIGKYDFESAASDLKAIITDFNIPVKG